MLQNRIFFPLVSRCFFRAAIYNAFAHKSSMIYISIQPDIVNRIGVATLKLREYFILFLAIMSRFGYGASISEYWEVLCASFVVQSMWISWAWESGVWVNGVWVSGVCVCVRRVGKWCVYVCVCVCVNWWLNCVVSCVCVDKWWASGESTCIAGNIFVQILLYEILLGHVLFKFSNIGN